MIHIWLDESDKHGTYYSNFYGGILVESRHREIVLQRMEAVKLKANIIDEIKWQKVNAYHFDKYIQLVDELFEMGKEGLLKIRIFFRHNQYEPELTPQKRKECLYDITPNRVAHKNAFISVIGEIKKPTDMKALIQKEIIRKPIYSHGEDINGRMESETTIVQILGVTVFKKVIQLLSVS